MLLSEELKAFETVYNELGMILPILQLTKVRLRAVKGRTKASEEAKTCLQEEEQPHVLTVLSAELGAE